MRISALLSCSCWLFEVEADGFVLVTGEVFFGISPEILVSISAVFFRLVLLKVITTMAFFSSFKLFLTSIDTFFCFAMAIFTFLIISRHFHSSSSSLHLIFTIKDLREEVCFGAAVTEKYVRPSLALQRTIRSVAWCRGAIESPFSVLSVETVSFANCTVSWDVPG